ncbi:MAG: VOC family protein [Pseudomonadales bacterium]|nr:VOC family protein [Pseudomonadales bacterium]
MEKVTGIGGFFFRSKDPKALAQWYATNLGIDLVPENYDVEPWSQDAGPTVFAPFSNDTEYFGRETQMWMLNLRVSDLDAMVAQLQGADVEVEVDEADYPNGRFARVYDPEVNPIELWEPK